MQPVNIGIIGLGNVGSGTLDILAENARDIALKLGFPLRGARAMQPRHRLQNAFHAAFASAHKTANWREVVEHPEVDIVAELVGGTGVAREIVEAAIARGKSVVTANKELMALAGAELWDRAIAAGINLAMEASVAGGIPIHAVLREGISGDRITTLYGILNGTCNYILTEIESRGAGFDEVLAEAQQAGYAEADPSADVDGFDARSKLAILSALAFGERIVPADIYTEGIRRITPVDFEYAHQLHHTIRLVCAARQTPDGLIAFRASVADSAIDHSGQRARRLQRGLGARQIRRGHVLLRRAARARIPPASPWSATSCAWRAKFAPAARSASRPSPTRASANTSPIPVTLHRSAYYLRFRVQDRPGIIAQLAAALAAENISIDAVLQLPNANWRDLPFVITVEPATEESVRAAIARMAELQLLHRAAAGDADGSCRYTARLEELDRIERGDLPLLALPLDGAL